MQRKIDVIIADDNQQSRTILRRFTELHKDFEIIEEASNGEELVQKVLKEKPQLVLLDINMPHLNGIEAIKACLQGVPNLQFIFITGYDEFAVEAFSISALDYIIKPVEVERLFTALNKAKYAINVKEIDRIPRLNIKYRKSTFYIPINEILFIEKQGRKSIVHTRTKTIETYETLGNLSEGLDATFFQSHRSNIINLMEVSEIKSSGETYLVYFVNYDKPAYISKQKIAIVQDKIKDFI
jgi:two-component system, LytTR family, response regulator